MDSASDSSYHGLGIHPVFRELQNDHQDSGIEVVNVRYKRQAHAAQSRSGFDDKQSIWHVTADKILVGRLGSGRSPKTRKAQRRLIFIILGLLLAVGTILAIALGITLRLHSPGGGSNADAGNSSTPNPPHDAPSSASSPHPPAGKSTSGALNGTGLAVLGPSDPSQGIRLLFQHHTGEIRSLGLQDGVWHKESPVVRTNIKKGTQLTVASYYSYGARASHLFYVDSSNILQEAISVDNGTTWRTGPLGDGKFRVANHSKTALTACNLENSSSEDGEEPVAGTGLKLWYGAEDDSAQELSWAIGDRWWRTTFVFSKLSAGNPLASSCDSGGYAYLWTTTDDNDDLALWWKDFGSSNNNGSEAGNWTQEPTLDPSPIPLRLRLATSLAKSPRGRAQSRIFFQSASESIESVLVFAPRPPLAQQPQPQPQNTTFSQQQQEVVAAPHTAMPETNIAVAVTDLFSIIHGPRVHVFFQDEGGGVVEYTIDRPGGGGDQSEASAGWNARDVPIDFN